ncbi:MAG: type II toxin-antitoxin system VapC family toxin [Acidimicrobiales bacterium]|nr:type II toxin-antitoxin system VapC family toxin [Acidimicrobiales bacterium]
MKVVDANVLLYAVNEDEPHHEVSRGWLDSALSGRETVGFAWIALLAFVRLATKPGLFPRPLEAAQALDRVDAWLGASPAVLVEPGSNHPEILRRLLEEAGTAGNLTSDAHLAAIAVAHRAKVVTFDRDFERFPGVRWERPYLLS